MSVILSDFIESVLNPNGRFRELEGIYPVVDNRGEPVMVVTEKTADFETVFHGREHFLRCLVSPQTQDIDRLKDISLYTNHIECPFIVPSIFYDGEILVFDSQGRTHYRDVVLQEKPRGQRLDQMLDNLAGKEEFKVLGKILEGLSDLALWIAENDFSHGNLHSRNVIVDPLLKPILINYTKSSRDDPQKDLRSLGLICACVYLTSCHPALYEVLLHERLLSLSRMSNLAAELRQIMQPEDLDPLLQLLDSLDQREDSSILLVKRINEISATPTRSYPSLMAYLEAARHVRAEHAERRSEKMNRYSFIGEMHDMLIRAREGDHWCYIDKHGDIMITGNFLRATDFSEGRAVVETDKGYGLIDTGGVFVIDPLYDDIEWDCMFNIAVVTSDGKSKFYSRDGLPLSEFGYDRVFPAGEEGICVVMNDGKYGYVNRRGIPITEIIYDEASKFRYGFGTLKLDNRIIIVDNQGQVFTDEENPAAAAKPF